MKEWLRTTMRLEEAWIGISISPKTAETTTETIKWADGSSFNGLPISNWVTLRKIRKVLFSTRPISQGFFFDLTFFLVISRKWMTWTPIYGNVFLYSSL
jgi:hypothetical protein